MGEGRGLHGSWLFSAVRRKVLRKKLNGETIVSFICSYKMPRDVTDCQEMISCPWEHSKSNLSTPWVEMCRESSSRWKFGLCEFSCCFRSQDSMALINIRTNCTKHVILWMCRVKFVFVLLGFAERVLEAGPQMGNV